MSVGESGRTCRNIDRRGKLSEEPFEVQIARDKVIVRNFKRGNERR